MSGTRMPANAPSAVNTIENPATNSRIGATGVRVRSATVTAPGTVGCGSFAEEAETNER